MTAVDDLEPGTDTAEGTVAARTLGARRIDYLPLDDVTPAERNVKLHDESGIRASIGRFGYVEPLVLDERTHRLVAGHGRLQQLQSLRAKAGKTGRAKGGPPDGVVVDADGRWLVPVVRGWASSDDAAAEAYLVASNRLTERGGWDETALADLLADLDQADPDLPALAGFADVEVAQLLERLAGADGAGGGESGAGPTLRIDEMPAQPAEPISRVGELIELGPHRLLVGDASDVASVRRVMGDHKAAALWTDPPYGVDLSARADSKPPGDRRTLKIHEAISSDETGAQAVKTFAAVLSAIEEAKVLQSGAAFFVAHPDGDLSAPFRALLMQEPWIYAQTLIWVKDSFILSRSDFHPQHEPIAYGRFQRRVRGRASGQTQNSRGWYGGNTISTVFHAPRPTRSELHPTMKPLDLISAQLRCVTRRGQHVLDVFAGSGSTLLAAHSLGLVAHLIELSPAYADVIAARYQHLTGERPVVDGLARDYPLNVARDDDAAEVVATVDELRESSGNDEKD